MKNMKKCCRCAINEDMREEMIDLLGEFNDILSSMADFTERLYVQLAEENDTCAVEYDDDEEDDEEKSTSDPEKAAEPNIDNFMMEIAERIGEQFFEVGMAQAAMKDEPAILVMNAMAGPMMLPASKVLSYIAENDKDVDVAQLTDDLYLCFNRTSLLRQDEDNVVTGPVFVLKGKPRIVELTPADVVRVFHEMEKRKKDVRCTNGKTFPAFRV